MIDGAGSDGAGNLREAAVFRSPEENLEICKEARDMRRETGKESTSAVLNDYMSFGETEQG